jgi:hypothetical protein
MTAGRSGSPPAESRPGSLAVVRGNPDDLEIAAVVIALLAVRTSAMNRRPAGAGQHRAARPGWGPVREYRPPGAWTCP